MARVFIIAETLISYRVNTINHSVHLQQLSEDERAEHAENLRLLKQIAAQRRDEKRVSASIPG